MSDAEACTALAPATPEALLRLMLELEPQNSPRPRTGAPACGPNIWKVVAFTSCGWLVVLGLMTAGFMAALERQGRQIELLLQRSPSVTQQIAR